VALVPRSRSPQSRPTNPLPPLVAANTIEEGRYRDQLIAHQRKTADAPRTLEIFNVTLGKCFLDFIAVLPKMAKATTSEDLRAGFEEHLEQTKGRGQRLKTIFKDLDEKPTGKKCKEMEGLIEEGAEAIEEYEGDLLDAALIGAAQRVEHYEMAGYGTVSAGRGKDNR